MSEEITIGVLLFACAAIQSMVGFAFTLFALPLLLLLTDLSAPQAVMLSLLGSLAQRLLMIRALRHACDWKKLLPVILTGLLGLPLGVMLLKRFSSLDPAVVRQWIGVLILVVVIVSRVVRIAPRERLAVGWGLLAGFASGLLNGMANIGGPPLIMWAHAHDWSNKSLRAAAPAVTLGMAPLQLFILFGAFGAEILPPLSTVAVALPAAVLGCFAGLGMGHRIPVGGLRTVATALLILLCAWAMLRPLISGM